jgi:large subunit ribosomal protein L37Ae
MVTRQWEDEIMAKKKKNVGIAGKFGPRYGVKVRKQIQAIEKEKVKKHTCPRCKHKSVKRVSSGLWKCNRCDLTFASGAYTPVQSKVTAIEAYKPTEEEANV